MAVFELFDHLPGTAVLIPGAFVAIYLIHSVSVWYRLSHIPGPRWAGFSRYWAFKKALKGQQTAAFKEESDKYGTLVRVGPNELITSDPDSMRKMMAVRSSYIRGPWWKAFRFDPARDNLLSMSDDVEHTNLRRKMAFGYSGKENTSMEATIDHQVASLVNLIDAKYLSTPECYRPVDFALKTHFFTLDIISDLAFGKTFGFLEQDEDVFNYVKITTSLLPALSAMGNIPWLTKALQSRLFRSLLPKATDKFGFGALIGVTNSVVASRYHPSAPSSPDMLGSFIRHGLTEAESAGEALLQVLAGSDTSATTIRIVLLSLLSNPHAYSALQSEIDSAIAANKISSPIKDSEARNLPYLQAVIKEGLRILPPAAGAGYRTVPPGGDTINGMFIPAGTQIGSSPLSIHHCKATFGEDAEIFRPERWLEASGETLALMNSTGDLVFHYGKWMCLGKPVAMMEFNKVFVELLRRFDFLWVRPEKGVELFNAGIWIIEDFWVRVTKREVVG